jgi:hypothetical protein
MAAAVAAQAMIAARIRRKMLLRRCEHAVKHKLNFRQRKEVLESMHACPGAKYIEGVNKGKNLMCLVTPFPTTPLKIPLIDPLFF